MYALDEKARHITRISGARAFRTPLLGIRQARMSRYSVLGTPLLHLEPNTHLSNETVYSAELGYRGQMTKNLAFSIDGYYMEYKDMIGIEITPSAHPILGAGTTVIDYQTVHKGAAQAFGAETQVEWNLAPLRLTAWYNFQQIKTDESLRGYLPAHHKAGLNALVKLEDGWAIHCNYKASSLGDDARGSWGRSPSYHILDLSVSKTLFDGHGQIHVGVNDILDKSDKAAKSVGTIVPAHETSGSTFFVKFIWEF
jgi:outer membrane receptor protein involved in Fe transport